MYAFCMVVSCAIHLLLILRYWMYRRAGWIELLWMFLVVYVLSLSLVDGPFSPAPFHPWAVFSCSRPYAYRHSKCSSPEPKFCSCLLSDGEEWRTYSNSSLYLLIASQPLPHGRVWCNYMPLVVSTHRACPIRFQSILYWYAKWQLAACKKIVTDVVDSPGYCHCPFVCWREGCNHLYWPQDLPCIALWHVSSLQLIIFLIDFTSVFACPNSPLIVAHCVPHF